MDFGAAVVADEQSFELVQPGEGALDDPAVSAESGAVLGLAARDHRLDSALTDKPPVLVVVVTPVGDQRVGSPPRPAAQTRDRRDRIEQRDQLGDVVAVAARECPGERDPARVDQEVMLGAVSRSVNRARARFGAPFFACT